MIISMTAKLIQNKLLPLTFKVATNREPVSFKDVRKSEFTKSSDIFAAS